MNILAFPIKLDFFSLLSFIVGLIFGVILILLIYVILVLQSLRDKKYIKKVEQDTLTDKNVKDMIQNAQKNFKDRGLRLDNSKVNFCKNICQDLALQIASSYYPNSKRPLLELTVSEALILIGYIQKRIEELLDRKVLRLLFKLNIASIVELSKTTIDITSSKAFKVTLGATKKASKIKKVLNVINPVTYIRTFVMNNILGIAIDKICLIVIEIVGEETYKIYSKKVFNQDVEIESNVSNLLDELDDDIKNITKLANENDNLEDSNDDFPLLNRPLIIKKENIKIESNPNLDFDLLRRE